MSQDTESKPNLEQDAKNIVLPPKKKRVIKRFTSKEQIIAKIDKFTAKAKRHRDKQKDCYSKAGTIRRHYQETPGFHEELAKATKLDAEGDRWGKKADRLEKDVLKVLSQKLAEFQTDTIPGITNDRSVPGI